MEYLAPRPGKAYLDCTLGHGGHALEIFKQLGDEGVLVGFDVDPHAARRVGRRIEQAGADPSKVKFVTGNFSNLIPLLHHAQVPPLGGILLDLGPSTPQLLDSKLGMSWENDEALDMRLDPKADGPNAAEIVNEWSEEELTGLFKERAQEKWSRRIAQRIIEARTQAPIRTGRQLGDIVAAAIPRKAWPPKTHPATRVFLALRMEVNRELENLEAVLPQAFESLAPGGRLVVISFHSGEDTIVKRFFQEMARPAQEVPWPLPQRGAEGAPRMKILTRRPVFAGEEEVRRNPRSRSARLRAAEKI